MKVSILVVEDDKAIRNFISATLDIHSYNCFTAENGEQAMILATSHKPDIIILDLGLPDIDGVDIIKKIRAWSNCPIIVVSARSEDKDKIEALDSGADDYLTKPFSVDELLARIRVAIRKMNYDNTKKEESTEFINGDLKIDYVSGCVFVGKEETHLTPIEYKLLCLLAKNVGKVLTHTYILKEIWGGAYESEVPSLRVFMATLRKKIEKNCEKNTYIQTHIGVGYRLVRIQY
ncbi:response regulator [Clostridium tertium]|jgi:two-component system, OmpR family, KDP operon response regulator KdpE|uniref:response regulator n=1 Tax=Clostridium tertium TaxID=1559 RepID=UPI00241CA9D7|nr:response regulator transcription factor [Clostridium tertium]MBS6503607.1 response regulator transcription factor [Clostridium sp.]MDI9217248.1 response regulator transcription factor [Clostridium tertium]